MKAGVLLSLLMLTGCEPSSATPPQPTSNIRPVNNSEMLWQRARECGADAERAATQMSREYKESSGGSVISSWDNHYNTRTERCYMSIVVEFQKWTKSSEGAVPIFSFLVFDLFDHAIVAAYTDEQLKEGFRGAFCEIGETTTRELRAAASCAAAKARAIELLTQ